MKSGIKRIYFWYFAGADINKFIGSLNEYGWKLARKNWLRSGLRCITVSFFFPFNSISIMHSLWNMEILWSKEKKVFFYFNVDFAWVKKYLNSSNWFSLMYTRHKYTHALAGCDRIDLKIKWWPRSSWRILCC